jgi:hypothetical protein
LETRMLEAGGAAACFFEAGGVAACFFGTRFAL